MNELRKLIVWLIFTFIQSYSISTNGWDTNYSKAGNVKFKRASLMNNPFVNMMMQMIAPSLNTPPTENFLDIFRDYYPLPNGLKSPYSEYDYVIVGAGSAGSVLAARLTEDPNVTVLLIEAGRPEHFFTDAPAISPYFQLTEYTWPYFMEPQKGVCLGMDNQRCFWPRGRAVGGTSVINYLIYTRGRPEEWDRIGAAGNQGWSYVDVLPYYMKTEDAKLKGYENSPYRGRDGELNVNFIPTRTPLVEAFLEAGRTLGHTVVDYNDPEQLGFGYLQVTANLGRRVSAAKAFLHPNKFRPNLHILQESRVTKVLINENDRSTYGVEFIRNYNKQGSIKQIVTARREVILSAGPIASPQLLMLSGIGPEEHLKSHGIPVIQNLPVGRTLYDHICFPGLIFTLNVTNVTFNENRQASLANVIRWTMFGDGPVSSAGGAEAIGYIKTPGSTEPERVPDIELLSIGGSLVSDGGPSGSKAVRRGMNINNEVFDKAYGSIDNTDTWSSFLMLLHPKSVGYLELRSKNPFQFPRIYGNYLTDPSDVRTLIAGIRYVQALAETNAFKKFGAKLHRARYPTCKGLRFNSDAYWECAIRTLTATLHHQIATCRMGPPNDPLAVVDPELRVYGVSRLRVVDSSIIPRTTAAHTNAPAIMIGEKAADMIKNFWSI